MLAHPGVPAPSGGLAHSWGLAPPGVIGIVGGGQLGRMLTHVAHRYGYRVVVLTGGGSLTSAGSMADVEIAASFADVEAVKGFVSQVDVITWELENVDECVAAIASEREVSVYPDFNVLDVAADRLKEKQAFVDAGVCVAPHHKVARSSELVDAAQHALHTFNTPIIIKTARGGYDGRGQIRLSSEDINVLDRRVFSYLNSLSRSHGERAGGSIACGEHADYKYVGDDSADGGSACGEHAGGYVVEQELQFDKELSVVLARGLDGQIVDHGVMENNHVNQILDTTVTPAQISCDIADEARAIAVRLAEHLNMVGVLCVEMFLVGSKLIVNEMAPRPHNSGHCTVDAAVSSQFEQQLRAVCGLPLGDGRCRPAAMAQLLGETWNACEPAYEPAWDLALTDPAIKLHLYGKDLGTHSSKHARRKMGHLTCVGSSFPDMPMPYASDGEVSTSSADTSSADALARVLAARERLVSRYSRHTSHPFHPRHLRRSSHPRQPVSAV